MGRFNGREGFAEHVEGSDHSEASDDARDDVIIDGATTRGKNACSLHNLEMTPNIFTSGQCARCLHSHVRSSYEY